MPNRIQNAIFAALFSTLLALGSAAQAQYRPFSQLAAGDYPDLVDVLGTVSYEPEVLHRLANPSLLFVDEDWMREQGYDMTGGLNLEKTNQILDALAFAGHVYGEPKDAYTDETKTFYSDYYGGDGVGKNWGSGRAASKGKLQLKGPVRTKMVDPAELRDKEHSSGTMGFYEGFMEILGSQIAHHEFPYGANRVIAMIATGTFIRDDDGELIPRVIVVREDPLRPAHFIKNSRLARTKHERERIETVMSHLIDVLPQKTGAVFRTKTQKLQAGIRESIYRHAQVAAYAYANHFLHSAFSPSNEEISNAVLDFGAFMALDGYPLAGRPDDEELNGTTKAIEWVLEEFLDSLKKNLPANLRAAVMTVPDALDLLRSDFKDQLQFEMAAMTGAPPELLEMIRGQTSVKGLGETLNAMSRQGNNTPYDALNDTIPKTDFFDLPKILQTLANTFNNSAPGLSTENLVAELKAALNRDRRNSGYSDILAKQYAAFATDLLRAAKKENITARSLKQYLSLAVVIKNKKTSAIIMADQDSYWKNKIWDLQSSLNPLAVQSALQKAIDESRRTYHDAAPFTIVLSETHTRDGQKTRDVFDLKTGRTKSVTIKPPDRAVMGLCHAIAS